jgi:hypothetical protein
MDEALLANLRGQLLELQRCAGFRQGLFCMGSKRILGEMGGHPAAFLWGDLLAGFHWPS